MGKINVNGSGKTDSIQSIRGTSEVKRGEKQSSDKVSDEAGKLDFSTRAAAVGKLVDNLNELPEIRQERVDDLRGQITRGEYNPPASEIADAILKDEK